MVIHHEDGSIWAEVPALPGCFASEETMAELTGAVEEAVGPLPRPGRPARPGAGDGGDTHAAVELEPA